MKITYDKTADALYIYLNKNKILKTIKLNEKLLVDIDTKGKATGIEILDASSQIPKNKLKTGTFSILSSAN